MKNIDYIYPGIAVIIFDEHNRVLLQKRKDVKLWGIISGHIEPGETVVEAAIREVKEETNLDIEVKHLIGVYSDPNSQVFEYPDGRNVHFITNCFLGKVVGGELKCDPSESLEIKYFNCDDLPKNLLNMHPKWLEDALAFKETSFIR
ncbi:NUDIX hydrolase domain-containing protein [Gottschalkia purinilytica]|uniref:NUDIX hydrolase domain-containing protein n=1 Tax=Gottschalkia purinilytica TaxID=1503 RepID=A0A0L0WCT7_GOTPU|nr:NUDIX domain-containing protein [Gottschalkia purinilytica]KNF09283.1 NUDIX hydrolase domain-containing protein [Gottschalkia purinilytica]